MLLPKRFTTTNALTAFCDKFPNLGRENVISFTPEVYPGNAYEGGSACAYTLLLDVTRDIAGELAAWEPFTPDPGLQETCTYTGLEDGPPF